jgi:spore coat polysaccharide biosynthesis protein SpsF
MNIAFIQARENSNRLPKKVLREIIGKPVLEHVFERVSLSKLIDKTIVLTGDEASNKGIISLCMRKNFEFFSGADEDVLLRFNQAIDKFGFSDDDIIIRITADCPLIDSKIIDLAIQNHIESGLSYSSTSLENLLPDGLDVELIKVALLKEINVLANDPVDREHVTKYIYSINTKYEINYIRFAKQFPNIRLTLDYEEDFEVIENIYSELAPNNPRFDINDIEKLLNTNPKLFKMNMHYERNIGLKISEENREFVTRSFARICIGTATLGMNYGIMNKSGQFRVDDFTKVLDEADKLVIEFIDTAKQYGRSETLLANLIDSRKKEYNIIGKFSGQKNYPKKQSNILIDEAIKSLDSLGIKSFYAYLLHDTSDMYDEKILEELRSLKGSGRTKYIGVSIYSNDEALYALDHNDIDLIQVKFNLFDQTLEEIDFFSLAEKKGKKVFIRSIFLQGVLLSDISNLPDKLSGLKKYLIKLDELADKFSLNRMYIALFFVLMKPSIDGVIIGIDNFEQFIQIVNTIKTIKINNELYATLRREFGKLELTETDPRKWISL